MVLDQRLLDILACPSDKGPLLYFADDAALYNPRLRLRYRVEGTIPVMLVSEATELDQAAHDELMSSAERLGIEPTFSQ